jgi:hypothetical protein
MYTYKYPHPAVATDCVIFGFDGIKLHVPLDLSNSKNLSSQYK